MSKTYAVGDIHGMYDSLIQILAWIEQDAAGEPAHIITLGDYVDRGPHSREVIERLMRGSEIENATLFCLRGNHDEMMCKSVLGGANTLYYDDWKLNGAYKTLREYSADGRLDDPTLIRHCQWLDSLHYSAEDEYRYYVHAGFRPGVPIDEQTAFDMTWIRGEFLHSNFDFGKQVVHGHTVTLNVPVITPRHMNIDTGAVYGGKLTVAAWDSSDPTTPYFYSI